jgi:hypothetical protein
MTEMATGLDGDLVELLDWSVLYGSKGYTEVHRRNADLFGMEGIGLSQARDDTESDDET